ncbi:MAG TPA: cobyrinate a,c-diamide synthase [Methanospirillum sp.]|uniref:cobyrinate a,c-diamide synthase n=1 Tax=Methanospirillum sp. TaxID=45200 RepID=UPI002CDDDF26|nr:cobyrinate a,c-diamide synthase [Methanospirillum sp.]HWQ64962.1 cobyrinate a,c-diamide synthase [Methanospirillum sp.]
MTENNSGKISIPRIIVAGIHSDCGKTTVSRGLMAALVKRGLVVQPFKVGPDFIDPSHHTQICGRISRNLDPIMMGEQTIRDTFINASKGADIAVIEGVMGMFDGLDGSSEGSTAHVARLLKAPVILVIPVKGMSGSVHAIAEGFSRHDPDVSISGMILNMVGSPRHKAILQARNSVDQIGHIPVMKDLEIGSRHLGLVMGEETHVPTALANILEEHADVPRLITIARSAPPLLETNMDIRNEPEKVRIAVARDPAFCFYYQDNLERLVKHGAELTFFSPMVDNLPSADMIYLGGGYPELHASVLESGPARDQIRTATQDGVPIYAECGGLMYLGKGLNSDTGSVRWAGILPVEACMEKRFQALGYTTGHSIGGPSVAPAGTEIRGHEFHYSRLDPDRDARYAINLSRGSGISNGHDGIFVENCMGSYTHAYFSDNMTKALISAAMENKKKTE